MTTLLRFLSAHATLLLAAGVGIGLVLPAVAELSRPLLAPSVWILLTLAAMRLDPARAKECLRRPLPVFAVLAWMLFVTPILCWLLVSATDIPTGLAVGLVLMAGAAPLMSTPALAQILKLDDTLAMIVMIAATILGPFTLPILALEVLGLELGIDPWLWSGQLTLFVGSAVLAGVLARRGLGPSRINSMRDGLDLAIVVLLLIFAVAIMDGVAARLQGETAFVLSVVAIAFGAYIGMLFLGTLAGLLFGWTIAATVGFVSANRNVGVILAVLPAGADPDIFLYFAIWQMPMYIMPAVLAPLYGRLMR